MEKKKNESSITDNKDIENNVDKRVLVVGKLKGKKENKPKKTKNTTKTNKPKATTKVKKASATKTNTKKESKPKTAVAKKENVSKVSVKKEEETKKVVTKNTGAKKATTKNKETKKIDNKNTLNKKVASKKAEPKKESKIGKIKITEKIENLAKPKKKTKANKTKKAMEQVNVLRVDVKSEEFRKIAKDVIIAILVIALAVSLIYIGNIGKENVSNRMLYSSLSKDIKMEELTDNGKKPTDAIKTLQQENPEVQGWIKIDGTNINYPLLQGGDNKYYLTHNFKNEKTSYGSIFMNVNSDLNNDKSNVIIYGHDMRDGQMFSDLIKYADKEYYDEHKTIKITTDQAEKEYTIVSVFKSKVFYQDERNVFRFYQYYNLENEKQFNDYVSNCKKLQLYDTGVEANYGDQLLTLITCEYSTENGRMVVIAKKN